MVSLIPIIESVLRGMAVGLASSITVGPVAVLCIKRTLSKRPISGFVSGLGVACADTLLATFAYFFYALMESQIEQYKDVITIVGGIIVIIVGVVIYQQKVASQAKPTKTGAATLWLDFSSMFGFTLANFITVIPYILAFFAMLGVAKSNDTGVSAALNSLFVLSGFLAGAIVWWALLSLLISLFRRDFRPHHMRIINRIAGVVIVILGVVTILMTVIPLIKNGNNI